MFKFPNVLKGAVLIAAAGLSQVHGPAAHAAACRGCSGR